MDKAKGYLNIEVTHQQAAAQLAEKNPEEAAEKSATSYHPQNNCFHLYFLKNQYWVYLPSGKIVDEQGKEGSLYLATIFLHYLSTADGTPLAGRWITFKELSGGEIYQQPFYKRAQLPFIKVFGHDPEKFVEAAASLGGFKMDLGDYCMVIPVLPRVPIAFVLAPGDDEIEPSCSILFDAHANCYLPTEDYAHLPAMILGAMRK